MRRVFHLEKIFISQYLKQTMEYKADFIVGVLGVLLQSSFEFDFLTSHLQSSPKIGRLELATNHLYLWFCLDS
jgi:ABC-type uncharacterized transport system, permease component